MENTISRWDDLPVDLADFEARCRRKGNRDYHALGALDRFFKEVTNKEARRRASHKAAGGEE